MDIRDEGDEGIEVDVMWSACAQQQQQVGWLGMNIQHTLSCCSCRQAQHMSHRAQAHAHRGTTEDERKGKGTRWDTIRTGI